MFINDPSFENSIAMLSLLSFLQESSFLEDTPTLRDFYFPTVDIQAEREIGGLFGAKIIGDLPFRVAE